MRCGPSQLLLCALAVLAVFGCRSSQPFKAHLAAQEQREPSAVERASYQEPEASPPLSDPQESAGPVTAPEALSLPEGVGGVEPLPPPVSEAPTIDELATSVRLHFPEIQAAIASRVVASGEALSARGAFDRKLEGASVSQPLDYYENYRQSLGLKRDTYWGGQTFAGYRIGRGDFEPWYLERETNKGGEFTTGVVVPLARDRGIDANRAELWRAQLERGRVEPEIRALVIASVRDGKIAYWQWVAATAVYQIAEEVLQLGLDRTDYLERQVELGEKAKIDLVDNRRIIVSRQAKLQDAQRKRQQSAVKLSLYLRDNAGAPVVLSSIATPPRFPVVAPLDDVSGLADVPFALANRPELEELSLVQRQLEVALRQANNEIRPEVDAGVLVAQDVGEPTSEKRDKSELKLEASLLVSVPLERRKALGKARQLRGKIAQLRAKSRFAADKIAAEAQSAHAALVTSAQRASQTAEGLELARQMQDAEQRRYKLGQSTLFNLNLREQQAAEAAVDHTAALYDYHAAMADYAAALGLESLQELPARPVEEVPPLEEP